MPEFRYLWEYNVRPEKLEDFQSAYGSDGDWARLLRRDVAYLGTELLQDRQDPCRFVTIDRWRSYSAYAVFRENHREEFDALDQRCEAFTSSERHLGDFEVGRRRLGYDGPAKHETDQPKPRSSIDDILDIYKKDVDMTLLRENLKLTPDERSRKFEDFMASLEEIRGAAAGKK